MQLYFNGDSFVAGSELGDSILPDYPGLLPYPIDKDPDSQHSRNKSWFMKSVESGHALHDARNLHWMAIQKLERSNCFAGKIEKITGLPITNNASGGSSMDKIARTTLSDLINLKIQHPNEKIVAFIGLTDPHRSEIAAHDVEDGDMRNWECISVSYHLFDRSDYAKKSLKLKLMYEHDYHQIINFYKNVILIKDFCRTNDIPIFFIAGNNIETYINHKVLSQWEDKFKESMDFKMLRLYADVNPTVDMELYAEKLEGQPCVCPGTHFGELVHELIAQDLIKLINTLL